MKSALWLKDKLSLPPQKKKPPHGVNVTKRHRPEHHTERGFTNPNLEDEQKSLASVVKMRFGSKWAKHRALAHLVERVEPEMALIEAPDPGAVQATWIGHSTWLLQLCGLNILTDPVFSKRASPVSWAGPKRYTPPALQIEALPPIDIVLISHNHYDHLDLASVRAIGKGPLWVVPLGNARILSSAGVDKSVELDWWQTHTVGPLKLTCAPAQHWSSRSGADSFKALWSGWTINGGGRNIYFVGDTGYNPHTFKEIGQRLGPFDLSLVPIGAYEPRWFMKPQHVNPAEAVLIHMETQSKRSLAMHWGTFPLTAERPDDPPRRLAEARVAHGLEEESFLAVPLGSTTKVG